VCRTVCVGPSLASQNNQKPPWAVKNQNVAHDTKLAPANEMSPAQGWFWNHDINEEEGDARDILNCGGACCFETIQRLVFFFFSSSSSATARCHQSVTFRLTSDSSSKTPASQPSCLDADPATHLGFSHKNEDERRRKKSHRSRLRRRVIESWPLDGSAGSRRPFRHTPSTTTTTTGLFSRRPHLRLNPRARWTTRTPGSPVE
jgi:hypothetical protein